MRYSEMTYEEYLACDVTDPEYMAGRWVRTRTGGKVWMPNFKWWFEAQYRKLYGPGSLLENEDGTEI